MVAMEMPRVLTSLETTVALVKTDSVETAFSVKVSYTLQRFMLVNHI